MLLLGGSPATLQRGQPPPELAELYSAAEAEVAQIAVALPNSVLGQLPQVAEFACHVATFAAAAPRVTTLGLTGLGLHLAVSAALASEAFERHFAVSAALGRELPAVWDFAQLPSLRSAVQLLRGSGAPSASGGSGGGGDARSLLQDSQVQMALEAAANSSTTGRRTPLYYAAEAGELAASA